jgi:hypothetical protein
MLAIRSDYKEEYEHAVRCLLDCQNPNGSWPSFIGDDPEGAWTTALALIALADNSAEIGRRRKGFVWLLQSAGKESSWLWRWKFRTTDRRVRLDCNKFGWPWQPNTNSWVVPTAFAIVALEHLPCAWGLKHSEFRRERGREMLLDRACPGGGWNAGNGVVYGAALAPHADDTAIGLLALNNCPDESVVSRSLAWLEDKVSRLSAPWSLAWSALALAAHSRGVDRLLSCLAELWVGPLQVSDNATLAVMALALDGKRSLPLFTSRS